MVERMNKKVYVGVEYRTGNIPVVDVKRVFSNESTAELWADQSSLREYETHALESRLGG